jgi:hypothetical protein
MESECGSLPVAGVVSVAVYKSDFDSVIKQIRQILEPAITRVIADTPERRADSPRALSPVQRHAHSLLHMLLVEETLIERRRRGSRVQRSDIVVIPSTVQNIRIENIAATETLRSLAVSFTPKFCGSPTAASSRHSMIWSLQAPGRSNESVMLRYWDSLTAWMS